MECVLCCAAAAACCGRAAGLLLLSDEEKKFIKGIFGSTERDGWDGIISSVAGAWCSDFLGFDLCGVVVGFCAFD